MKIRTCTLFRGMRLETFPLYFVLAVFCYMEHILWQFSRTYFQEIIHFRWLLTYAIPKPSDLTCQTQNPVRRSFEVISTLFSEWYSVFAWGRRLKYLVSLLTKGKFSGAFYQDFTIVYHNEIISFSSFTKPKPFRLYVWKSRNENKLNQGIRI